MTFEQLRIFIAVAEREHVTRASEALNLSQSAVSSAISLLEQQFGLNLFHRVGRGIVLTEAGRFLLPEARVMLSRARSVEDAIREFSGLRRGRITIHASQTISSYFLPPRLARFHAHYPGIELVVAPDSFFFDAVNGGQLPSVFRASIRNLGPDPETIALSFPNFTCGTTKPGGENISCTWPPIRPMTPDPPLL